ncbi:protein involved in ribonucleotide reduction [Paenibacillus sp. LBL]|uniref:class Ib ribonucleoside-diphosphate reductase assembly flavoprotein NrdI n=1 Tax=Paenibacillus sp. LBL TaxID=2940563 RepID=UPI0024758A0D|nr:class Ib ribonucleoside-diphosphate reductase assembly flavoprotein NrdI [Paenibacillus sp. LBL]MDH6674306.1 protein involved in ribonucleotide reduction [Paenibacillus sp. LBL]
MIIVYASLTGKVKRFIAKLDLDIKCIELKKGMKVDEPFILVTYTTGFGEVPKVVMEFLEGNHSLLKGVAASGNRNWGPRYGISADIISRRYNVPIISKFEMAGTPSDVSYFQERVLGFASY